MPVFFVRTPAREYPCVVERGAIASLPRYIPSNAGKLFAVTTEDVWRLHGQALAGVGAHALFFPGGEERKRMAQVETLAEQMVAQGADRTSVVIALGGGIAGDLGGFLAAIFMRGVPVIQIPTTLLAQVDAAIGGKTGANLVSGKNLIGAFHQPLAVLIDPAVLSTLPAREYRAGLYEAVKYGIISSPRLFDRMLNESAKVLALDPEIVDDLVAESVRIKARVVSKDERESGLRRILNYGHTIGHALEAETAYSRLLHGEAVAFGMRAAIHLARLAGVCAAAECDRMLQCIDAYGALPPLDGIQPDNLIGRLASDKKTIQGKVHFVLAEAVGRTRITTGMDAVLIRQAIEMSLA